MPQVLCSPDIVYGFVKIFWWFSENFLTIFNDFLTIFWWFSDGFLDVFFWAIDFTFFTFIVPFLDVLEFRHFLVQWALDPNKDWYVQIRSKYSSNHLVSYCTYYEFLCSNLAICFLTKLWNLKNLYKTAVFRNPILNGIHYKCPSLAAGTPLAIQ